MRKVILEIKTLTLVPIVTTIKAIVTLDESESNLKKIAKAIVKGREFPDTITVEDASFDKIVVQYTENESDNLNEQVVQYLEDIDSKSKILDYEVVDSK